MILLFAAILGTLIIVIENTHCSFFNELEHFSNFTCEFFAADATDFQTFSLDDVETLTFQISCPVNCIATLSKLEFFILFDASFFSCTTLLLYFMAVYRVSVYFPMF